MPRAATRIGTTLMPPAVRRGIEPMRPAVVLA